MQRFMTNVATAAVLALSFAPALSLAPARAASPAAPAQGQWTMSGTKQIILHTRDGKTIPVGTITFKPDGDKVRFTVDYAEKPFEVYFLSMRNFKCVNGPEVTCAVPYPYDNPQTATPTNLNWLADNLLFMFKSPSEHAATMTNGMRFDLKLTDHGITGAPQAINLDDIASPPKDPSVAPYPPSDRDDYPADSRYIDRLTIE